MKHKSVTYDNIISVFKAIRRLQIIYELNAEEISNGKINNYTFPEFDGNHCNNIIPTTHVLRV